MKKDRRPQDSTSPIETLRLERTQLSQAEFAVSCGIPLRTYQRWVSGETEAIANTASVESDYAGVGNSIS